MPFRKSAKKPNQCPVGVRISVRDVSQWVQLPSVFFFSQRYDQLWGPLRFGLPPKPSPPQGAKVGAASPDPAPGFRPGFF